MARKIASIHETTKAFTPEVVTANSGTSAATFAAGDDSRITGAAQKASNLSDLASAATARTNLGLGTAATTAATDYATAAQGELADATTVQQVTLTAPLAYTMPVSFPAGIVHRVTFTQDGTGGHTVTYDGAPVSVALTAGASTTVELYPVGAGYVVRYPDIAAASAARAQPFGWVTPRDPVTPAAAVAPTVTYETSDPYAAGTALPYDSPLIAHPAGKYTVITWPGGSWYDQTANLPLADPDIIVSEFMLTGSECAPVIFASSTVNNVVVWVDGTLAYDGVAPAEMTKYWLKIVFPFAGVRSVRVMTYNAFSGGLTHPATAAVSPPSARRPKCALYGDSWSNSTGATSWRESLPLYLTQALGWDITRMGHGGSGYVADLAGDSQPLTDAARIANLAAQDLDYVIILGSINDSETITPAAVGAAASSTYAAIAAASPRTKLVVVGMQPLSDGVAFWQYADSVAKNNAIRAAAAAAPNVVRFLDCLTDPWIGTAAAEPANWADTAHLTSAGQATFARRLARELVAP